MQGFRLFSSLMDIVLTFKFGHDSTVLKWQFLDKVDYIDNEPALE